MSIIFEKIYSGESIVDTSRDIYETFNPDFNPLVHNIPTDEHGFQTGSFKVTVEWIPDEQDS